MTFALRPKLLRFESVWDSLKPAVLTVITLSENISHSEWTSKFGDIYDICVAVPEPLGDRLYRSVKQCLEEHAASLYQHLGGVERQELLAEYHRTWKVYYAGSRYLHTLFVYLNRQFVKNRKSSSDCTSYDFSAYITPNGVKEIGTLAMDTWREKVMEPMLVPLVTLLLQSIYADRSGTSVENMAIVAGVIQSFVEVEDEFPTEDNSKQTQASAKNHANLAASLPEKKYNFYKDNFEQRFIEATRVFYSKLANELLEKYDVSKYMEAVIVTLEEEHRRTKEYCPSMTLTQIMRTCQEVFIENHKERLYAVVSSYIKEEELEDLHHMYKLLKPLGALAPLIAEFEKHVRQKGFEAILTLSADAPPMDYVKNILQVHDKFDDMKSSVFANDNEFSSALDKALVFVVNAREDQSKGVQFPRAAERLSRFIDQLLRKTAKGLTESEIDFYLVRAIVIFRYLADKDLFIKFYTRMLSSRLIHGASVSMDSEEMMIAKLKNSCGYEYTNKLTRMYMDIGLSKDLHAKFLDWCAESGTPTAPPMTPLILQQGAWPLTTNTSNSNSAKKCTDGDEVGSSLILPVQLMPCIEAFQKFYTQAHNGRRLQWLYHLSSGEMKLNYLDKSYIVMLSVHQMALLLNFSTKDSCSLEDLSASTSLSGEVLIKTVKSIVDCGLLKYQEGDENTVLLNTNFSSKRIRFKVPTPQLNRQQEKEVEQIIDQTLSRFTPDIPFIKKTIEDLIEKGYIQRVENGIDEYQYLA